MSTVLHRSVARLTHPDRPGYDHLWFRCEGCRDFHAFSVGPGAPAGASWSWNGDLEKPVFGPSLMCNRDEPKRRCHSYVGMGNAGPGQIEFLSDCHHDLKSQVRDLLVWHGFDDVEYL